MSVSWMLSSLRRSQKDNRDVGTGWQDGTDGGPTTMNITTLMMVGAIERVCG